MTERMRAKFMKDDNLFPGGLPAPTDPRFGTQGCAVGTVFESRKKLAEARMHARTYAGIWGSIDLGAFSIVVSHGYADDRDEGDFIVYTGTGGQEDSFSGTSVQVADQTFDHKDNRALQKSVETRRPVRVIRGDRHGSKYAPEVGYRFDGMYVVERAFMDKGIHGYLVCKYHLRRKPGQPPLITRY